MSTVPAVTMQELELETAELLPSRETLWVCHSSPHSSTTNNIFSQVAAGNGNTNQAGFLNVSALNGNLSGNEIVIL
ncbi:MAG TPA: hypothetical protein VN597_16510 [Streptosporangiaceae bacterium]|jgi:hypothetical protein|nr:hypothetical protein [Streptosporangiaceae bacterium]